MTIDLQRFVDSLGPLSISKDDCLLAIYALLIAKRLEVIEECAIAAEQQDRAGREWVRESLWHNILRRAGANVRALKGGLDLKEYE